MCRSPTVIVVGHLGGDLLPGIRPRDDPRDESTVTVKGPGVRHLRRGVDLDVGGQRSHHGSVSPALKAFMPALARLSRCSVLGIPVHLEDGEERLLRHLDGADLLHPLLALLLLLEQLPLRVTSPP